MDTQNEKKSTQKKLICASVFVIIAVTAMILSWSLLNPKYAELKHSINATSSIARRISAVEEETRNYERILSESGKEYKNILLNKDAYIAFLGEITMANKLNINKMTVDDISTDGQIYSLKVQIELQGNLYNVKNLVQQLYDSTTVSRINSFSYRLQDDNNLMWMWREIDDETLVPWWEIGSNKKTDTGQNTKQDPICIDDLLTHGEALCYLDLEFLGLGVG